MKNLKNGKKKYVLLIALCLLLISTILIAMFGANLQVNTKFTLNPWTISKNPNGSGTGTGTDPEDVGNVYFFAQPNYLSNGNITLTNNDRTIKFEDYEFMRSDFETGAVSKFGEGKIERKYSLQIINSNDFPVEVTFSSNGFNIEYTDIPIQAIIMPKLYEWDTAPLIIVDNSGNGEAYQEYKFTIPAKGSYSDFEYIIAFGPMLESVYDNENMEWVYYDLWDTFDGKDLETQISFSFEAIQAE